jgi:hypothetical protein
MVVDLRWSRRDTRQYLVMPELNRVQSLSGSAEDQTRSKLAT